MTAGFKPVVALGDPARRYATPGDLKSLVQSSYWGYRRAPDAVKLRYFDFPPIELAKDVLHALVDEKRWLRRLRDAARYARFDSYRSAQSREPQSYWKPNRAPAPLVAMKAEPAMATDVAAQAPSFKPKLNDGHGIAVPERMMAMSNGQGEVTVQAK